MEKILGKPQPTWQGMPPEIMDKIVKDLNVLDRSFLRKVSKADQDFVDTRHFPKIHTIDVLADSTDLKIIVQETPEKRFEFPNDEKQLSNLIAILESPEVKIEKLNFSSGRSAFGEKIQQLVSAMKDNGISKNSVQVKEFSISSETYITKEDPYRTEITEIPEIKDLLEFCQPEHLKIIKIDSKFADGLWKEISKIEQWRNVESIDITKNQNFDLPIFNAWNGKHLKIVISYLDELHAEVYQNLGRLFRVKPMGSSFKIHYNIDKPKWPMLIDKLDDPEDNTKSLYIFYSVLFVRGFVRPSDGTEERRIRCDPFTETRHLD